MKKNIVFFTGAGMSKESGLLTFRGKDGNWNLFDNKKVASLKAWNCGRRNNRDERRAAVLDFFNPLRRMILEHEPNEGHYLIASLEDEYNVTIITQNGDDYHTRAGSKNVIYLHGEALKNTSSCDTKLSFEIDRNNPDIKIGDKCEDKSQVRPYVIFFDELIEEDLWKKSVLAAKNADYFVVIGCSLLVFPAVDILKLVSSDCNCYTINPDNVSLPEGVKNNFVHLKCGGSEGMKQFIATLNC